MKDKIKSILRPFAKGIIFSLEKINHFRTDSCGYIPSRWRQVRGNYEPETVDAIRASLTDTDIAFDVGANIGYLTRVMSNAVGKNGKVLSFEPNPRVFDILKYNTQKLDNVAIFQYGLGEKNSEEILYAGNDGNVSSFIEGYTENHLKGSRFEGSVVEEKVMVKCGDEFAMPFKSIALLKVDVEGFEMDVFRGLKQSFLKKKIKTVIFEVARKSQKMANREIIELFNFLSEFEFKFYVIEGVDANKEIEDVTDYIERMKDHPFYSIRACLMNEDR